MRRLLEYYDRVATAANVQSLKRFSYELRDLVYLYICLRGIELLVRSLLGW